VTKETEPLLTLAYTFSCCRSYLPCISTYANLVPVVASPCSQLLQVETDSVEKFRLYV